MTVAPSVEQAPTSYDEVPYISQAFAQTHPDRLATVATLFNLKPKSIKNCRVLEIGSALGDNLIPMAYGLPDSQFVGIDLASRQVTEAKRRAEVLGLKNLDMRVMNIMDVNEELGKFDYVIAHGIFSWIPDEVQDKMFDICRDLLNPDGIGYISYNTYPGWHFRGMIRDMMLYHTKNLRAPAERAQQARALLDFLSTAVPTDNNSYGIMLKTELEYLKRLGDSYLLHDHLEELNKPMYFHQFVERANDHGLQFVGEADFAAMISGNFTKEVDETIRRISNEIVRTEQYMDFVRNRTFRQSLLCHKEVVINRNLGPLSVMPFYVGCPAKPAAPEVDATGQTFQAPSGVTFNTGSGLVKAAFSYMSEIWPLSVKFDELVKVARERSSTNNANDAEVLAGCILTAYASAICVLRTEPGDFTVTISEKPIASNLAREQSKIQEHVTNQIHENIQVDIISRHLLQFLDGSRDKTQLVEELTKLVQNGTLVVHQDGKILKEGEPLRQALIQSVDYLLTVFSKTALLIG